MEVHFTQHVRDKIDEIRQYGFDLTKEFIEEAVRNPDRVVQGYSGQQVAQKTLTNKHLLRMVFELQGEVALCITISPGRRSRYE